jgi:hypothetical protein
MESTLVETVKVKLAPRPVQSAVPLENLQVERLIWKDTAGVDHTDLQITWISRITTQYQLQYAADLKAVWTNVGDPVRGNNGPMVLTQAMVASGGYYRLSWSAAVPDSPAPVREYTFAKGLEDAAGSGVAAESLGGTVTMAVTSSARLRDCASHSPVWTSANIPSNSKSLSVLLNSRSVN